MLIERWLLGDKEIVVPHVWGTERDLRWEGPEIYETTFSSDASGWLVFHGVSALARVFVNGELACEQGDRRRLAIVMDGLVESAPPVAPEVQCGQGIADGGQISLLGETLAPSECYEAVPNFSEGRDLAKVADNIIVMVDEAHRTQEGDLGRKMREALPASRESISAFAPRAMLWTVRPRVRGAFVWSWTRGSAPSASSARDQTRTRPPPPSTASRCPTTASGGSGCSSRRVRRSCWR